MVQEAKKQTVKTLRQLTGEVVGIAENKTIRVLVKTVKMNAKYHKQYQVSDKYPVHDEKKEAKLGDKVIFVECRPLSKTKRWRLTGIVK
jgi:small subunit ribosomal protein S17